jgi:pSer/pThr/pTyr-binding forkhead associated (FHA) protein
MSDPVRTYLTVIAGPKAGTKYELDPVDNLLIGSDESCPFCIDAPGISPIHARIWADAEGITVFDTHSPTGIYVNDDKVVEKSPLRNGDILWLGSPGDENSVMIQVSMTSSDEAVAEAPVSAEAVPGEPFADEAGAMPEPAMAEAAMAEPAMPEPVAAAPEPIETFEPEMPLEPGRGAGRTRCRRGAS